MRAASPATNRPHSSHRPNRPKRPGGLIHIISESKIPHTKPHANANTNSPRKRFATNGKSLTIFFGVIFSGFMA